jgi:hypothetical protein
MDQQHPVDPGDLVDLADQDHPVVLVVQQHLEDLVVLEDPVVLQHQLDQMDHHYLEHQTDLKDL